MPVARVEINGRIARVEVPAGTTPEQARQIALRSAKDDSRLRGLVLGAVKPLDNAATWLTQTPVGRVLDRLGQSMGLPSTEQGVRQHDRARQINTRTGYQGAGTAIGTLPTMYLPGGVLVQGAAAGALSADKPLDAKNVAIDAAGGAIAGKVGEKVLAPVAERLGRTQLARKAAETVVKRINQASGALPARVRPAPVRALPNPAFTPADRAVAKTAVTKSGPDVAQLRKNLEDAARLKLPYSLADADPRLRMVAGSATRRSPDARLLAEETMIPRANGQAERAVNAIDEHLAPITKIGERSREIIESGKPVYGPLYDEAYAAPVVSSPRLDQILSTPAGREATGRANTIAANEFRDPKAMGFAVDDAGNVVLTPQKPMTLTSAGDAGGEVVQQPGYTTQSLDYVKRGIDDILEPQRNPITGKLNLDEGGRAINGVQRALIGEVDNLNPAYKAARDSYGEYAKRAEALRTGHDVLPSPSLPERDFQAILARQTDDTLPEMGRGYATAMADNVANRRFAADPYDAIYGTPAQRAKVATLFPEGSDDFGRIYQLEKDMAATKYETVGGSPTASRQAADKTFDANEAGDFVIDTIGNAGVPSPSSTLKMGTRMLTKVRDAQRAWRASEIAPSLLNPNPQTGLQLLDDLVRKQAEAEARRRAYEQAFSPLGIATVPLLNGGGS